MISVAFVTALLGMALAAPSEGPSRNLVSNSGFEKQRDGWVFWRRLGPAEGVSFEFDGKVKFEGKVSVRVASPPGAPANIFTADDLACEGEKPYTLSVYARTEGAKDAGLALWTKRADGGTIEVTMGHVGIPADVGDFRRFSTTVTLPAECASVRPILLAGGGTVWWDAVQFEQSRRPSGYVTGWGPLERREAGRKVACTYARAIIDQARLRDLTDQLERLVVYIRDAGLDAADTRASLGRLRAEVGELEAMLQTDAELPEFLQFDYDAIGERLSQAIEKASRAHGEAADLLASSVDWFERSPVEPVDVAIASVDKRDLLDRFIIFPLILGRPGRDYKNEADWEMLRAFGFPALCAWDSCRHFMYRPEGESVDESVESRLALMDDIISTNAAEGFKTSIWVEPESVVRALEEEYGPAVYLHDRLGTYYRRSRIHTSVNIWHPAVVSELERFMTTLGERYRDNPNVLCYEIFEEPSLVISNPRPKRGTKLEHGPAGYSDPARLAFRAYLAKKYGSLAALNERWGADFKSFDDVEPPTELAGPGTNPAMLYDFCRFRTESHAEFYDKLAKALKKADPVHAVVPQFIPMFYAWRSSGNDSFLMAAADWDFYATHDWPGLGPAWESAYTYSAAHWAGKPMWTEEYIWSSWVRRDQGERALWAGARCGVWRQLAWGKRGLELFAWERGWNTEWEGDWNNCMLNERADRTIPRYAVGVFPVVAEKMERLCRWVYGTEIVNDGLGQLVPTTTLLAAESEHSAIWWARKITQALMEDHWAPLFFPEEMAIDGRVDLAQFRVIVVPPAPLVPEALVTKLLAWVDNGGSLIWVSPFGTYDELGRPTGTLDEIVKSSRSSFRAGVKEAPHGQGRLVQVSGDVLNLESGLLNELIERECPTRAVYSPSRDVELVLRQEPSGDLVLVVTSLDVYRAAKAEIAVRGRWEHVVDLAIDGGAPVPCEFDGERTVFVIRTGPGEGVLVRLSD